MELPHHAVIHAHCNVKHSDNAVKNGRVDRTAALAEARPAPGAQPAAALLH
jgi:hypothetical protein